MEHVSYAREPLIVGVPWNAISTSFELFCLCYLTKLLEVGMGLTERTFSENQGCPMGLHFHRRGPSWKTQVVQWVSRLHTKGPLWKTAVRPMGLHLFLEGTFVETGGGPIDPMLSTRRTFLENEVVQWTSFFTEGIFMENSRGPKGSLFSQKGSFMGNKKVLQFLSCTRVSHQLNLTKMHTNL